MGYVYVNSRGKTYHLNKKTSKFKGSPSFTHYFYSGPEGKYPPNLATVCEMPDGYETQENPRNGQPFLRKKKIK